MNTNNETIFEAREAMAKSRENISCEVNKAEHENSAIFKSSATEDILGSNKTSKLLKIGAYISVAGLIGIYATEVMAVDFEAAAKSAIKPVRNMLVFAEPYLLGIAGMASLYFSEGDGFRKTIKTGAAVVSMWGLSQGLISWMPVIA